ncbi:hypothetical protein BGZ49_007595 [Haplosporangium sp. Z 27]|nr:hypothetical protein BGZ49_007595 [Haplosporangium sp. Z 27]
MCGRTAQGLAPAQIRQQLDNTLPRKPADSWIGEDKYRTSYNVAPTRYQPVVRADPKTNSYVVHMMHTKAMPDYSSVLKSINARDDSLFMGPTGKAMFSHSKNYKRCILLAEGRGKERVPFYTKRRDGNMMLMAAIYDIAQIQGSTEPLYTYATITTNASPQLEWLHDRMPVLIPNGDSQKIRMWLDPNLGWNSALEAMLKPCDEFIDVKESSGDETSTSSKRVYALETYQVDEKVNSVKNDSPEFAQPWNSSSNKKTLNRFFLTKEVSQDIPPSPEVKREHDLVKGTNSKLSMEFALPNTKVTSLDIIDANNSDSSDTLNDSGKNECQSEDEDHDLKRALGLSMKEHDGKNNIATSASKEIHESATRSPSKNELNTTNPLPSVDLLEKRRSELQQEEEEMKRVLELSLLQAIADGHEDTITQDSTHLSECEQVDILTKKEQDELERAIAASLNESENLVEATLSQQSTSSPVTPKSKSSSPGPKKQQASANTTPKKRKSNTSASSVGGGGNASKSRKSNQDVKITNFFQNANPH